MDEDLEVDLDRAALEHAIGVLKPLRQHRQASAERARRQIEQELHQLHEQLLISTASLNQERDNQKLRRQQLSDTHLERTMELSDIDRWHEKERRMLDRLAHIRQSVSQLRGRIEEQEHQLQQAQQAVKARQRAVEKLACMSESLDEN
ncbi:YscO family type III secretion system apparatus protein [Pseudomonas fluorescens]|uniref:YscO family type III secretion system apparatus protein n=1 Tax=Pseudomonas TaxID=286 RepID=UPI001908A4EE|nr:MULTISPECIES: YscO family type III secretion system apparatus protein [Pseudomonas]MBD8094615.1 YscO family type III secretion system apparatus protein [Pseudomonas fluorescens]MBD8721065.1 YscO family type III secretion system apparatus protein [Pseudomonas fluorescens]MDL2186465.1 YscO family type III secretion system apparatus protein [Pseudomonas sp. ChxA]